ncbi:hypothetical protein SCUP515_01068 [Seiridium cupressi]
MLIDHMGQNGEAPATDAIKLPMGLINYNLAGHAQSDVTWKLTGNLGGENYKDLALGPRNAGAIFAERQGHHQPSPPSEDWAAASPIKDGVEKVGIGFYTTTFPLDVPEGFDVPLSFVFVNPTTSNYRVQLCVNGWQYRKYVAIPGPQTDFPVPEGILNHTGLNTVAITLCSVDGSGAKLNGLSLEAEMPLWSCALLSLLTVANAATHELIVGTFGTKFLYTLEFDDESLTLDLVANTSVPIAGSWVALSVSFLPLVSKKELFAVQVQGSNSSIPGFTSYSLENATEITHTATIPSGGNCTATAIFVVADPNPPHSVYGSFFGSNAGCGTVLSVDETGTLEAAIQNYTYFSSSAVHGTAFSPDSKFLYSADDSGNTLWTHSIDQETGEVTLVANLTAPSSGADPRHAAVHPNGTYIYVVLEGSSQVAQYSIDADTGIPSFDNVTYPLLVSGEDAADYWADEVALSFSNGYLWATNRGRNTNTTGYISAFTLDEDGAISEQKFLLPTTSSGGAANSVAPSPFSDRFAALTDSSVGFVEIWELADDGSSAQVIAHLDLNDGGCCANAVWHLTRLWCASKLNVSQSLLHISKHSCSEMATSKQRFQDVIDFLHRAAQAQGRLNLFSFAFQNVLNDVTRDPRTLQSDGIITNGQLRYAVCRELPGRMNLRYPGAITDAPGCLDGETDLRLISIRDLVNTLSNPALTVYDKIQLCKDGQIEEPTTEDQLTQTSAFVAYKFRETAQNNAPAKRHSSSRAAFKFELYRVVHNAIWPQNSLSFHSPPVSFPLHRPSGEPRLKAERLQQASRKRMSVAQILKFIDTGIKVPFLPDVKQSSLQAPSTPTSTTLVYCDRKQEEPAWLNAIDPTSTTQCWYYDPTGSKDMVVGKSGDNSLCYSMNNLNMDVDDEDEGMPSEEDVDMEPDGIVITPTHEIIDRFRKAPRPFRMAADPDDPQDVHITDPEFWNLAKALAKADMHCIAFMARGVYKVSSQQFAGLADSADSWHYPPSSTAPYVSTQQEMEGWSQSIQAFSEKMTLSDWVSRNDNQEGREIGPAYLREIIEVRDDSWARDWSEIIQKILSDYNNVRHRKRVFHQQYLKAAEFEQLWREAFTAAIRIEAAAPGPRDPVSWIENLKESIDEAAEIVEGFVCSSIRHVEPATIKAIESRALAIENIRLQMDGRFQREKREIKVLSARNYNSETTAGRNGSVHSPSQFLSRTFLDSGPGTFHAVTGAALVLACVPAMVAWSYSETGPGGSGDADFWWLLPSVVFQLLALAIFAIPMLTVNPPRTKGRLWVWIYTCIGSTLTILAIPLYLWASVRYSSAATFLGNVVVALLHVQVSLAAISSAPKRKTE